MKNFATLLSLLFLLSPFTNLVGQTKDWTILLYVVGTDIVEDAITDIEEMKAAGNTDNINIVGLLGGADIPGWQEPAASAFINGQETSINFSPSDDVMVSTTNLTEFINYGVANYPAEKYMLLFYNHGMAMRGWGWANTTDTQFKINDLKAGIENTNFIQQGNKFEILGFDACLMACLEAQSALQDVAEYYIASEETEPWHAWNWTPIITAMNSQPSLDGTELGKIIVDTYIQHSKDKNTHHVTLSLVDLTKIDKLEKSVEALLLSLDDEIFLASFLRARGNSEEYSKSVSKPEESEDMVDIGDLVKNLKDLEPILTPQIDTVLARLDAAVLYERSDSTRPQASGISMYVPMNLLVSETDLNNLVTSDYMPIEFSDTIKKFISEDYLNYALADDEPLSGDLDNSLGFAGGSYSLGQRFSALKLGEDQLKDLHQIQIILLEEITGTPDEFLLLGSSHPDTIVNNPDGSSIFGYEWDEEWLSINDIPAYVADIQDFEVKDSSGSYTFTKLHIPAILNSGTSTEKNIIFSYIIDENFNYTLEGILRESYRSSNGTLVTSKERIELTTGDKVQLIYEVFDAETNESVFVANDNAIINIQSGNDDLVLGHTRLEEGDYHIGFVLMDHAHNDTIIYDPMVRTVMTSSSNNIIEQTFITSIYPNPFSDIINIEFKEAVNADITISNSFGQIVKTRQIANELVTSVVLNDLISGIYTLEIRIDNHVFQKILVKQ